MTPDGRGKRSFGAPLYTTDCSKEPSAPPQQPAKLVIAPRVRAGQFRGELHHERIGAQLIDRSRITLRIGDDTGPGNPAHPCVLENATITVQSKELARLIRRSFGARFVRSRGAQRHGTPCRNQLSWIAVKGREKYRFVHAQPPYRCWLQALASPTS